MKWTIPVTGQPHTPHPAGDREHPTLSAGMPDAGEMWDRRFTEQPWPGEPDPFLVELAGRLQPGRGLDLGSGPGRNSLWLARRGWDMTLVDVSRVGLAQAAERARREGIRIKTILADVFSWDPGDDTYDLVVVANLHPGSEKLTTLLERAAVGTRPGGHLFVVGHHLSSLGRHGPPDPDRLFTLETVKGAIPAGLAVERLEVRSRRADHGEDSGQQGSDVVVLCWATKLASAPRRMP